MACTDDAVLLDVVHAFRNLHVDPADCLKFGIHWQGQLYVGVAIEFGWVHGRAVFQLCFDAISFIMAKHNFHCYIDDYIAVIPRAQANIAVKRVCMLLQELGLT